MTKGDCYAIWHGKFTGKFMVYIDTTGMYHKFIILGNPHRLAYLTDYVLNKAKEPLSTGTNNNLPGYIDYVETIPEEHFKIIEAQYQVLKEKDVEPIYNLFIHR